MAKPSSPAAPIKGAAASKVAPVLESPQPNLPLFFKRPRPLELERHGKAGLVPVPDTAFATQTNSILINAIEFSEAAKQYPIVFTHAELPLPVVVLGLEQENYFVDAKGKWKEDVYIPAYVRKYPFVFMDATERREFLLCIDEAASQFREKGGKDTMPFYEGDKPSELTRNALEFCTSFHNHHQMTRQFCQALVDAQLLMPVRSDAKLSSGREIHLSGFQTIDEQKFNALPEATILEFHKKGWLPLIYFMLMSSSNWKKLVDMAAAREGK